MAKKWTNRNLPGALHFITANCDKRFGVFKTEANCLHFFEAIRELKEQQAFKLVAYVVMPDHIHLIVNPRDGAITDLTGAIKGLSARRIIEVSPSNSFLLDKPTPAGATHRLWQDSFKALPLWSDWMIWQKINYIHNNPLKARLAISAGDYRWSSFMAFYFQSAEPLLVDRDWWWPDDVKKLEIAMAEWQNEIGADTISNKGASKIRLVGTSPSP